MTDDVRISFLTYYVRSLNERTRDEKSGTKFGFDWIIYNLGLAGDWIPYRLPFLRSGGSETSKTKTEPEFGVDLAFLSQDRQTLRIFVLKDEVLNNANWGSHSFDIDLRNASSPDLGATETAQVSSVEVILAYNKDEDGAGIILYDRLVSALGTKVGDHASLRFSRWNLTAIVEEVRKSLLTPSLLPQKFFSHFTYMCSQFGEFRHGSDEWLNQMIPNWRRFLDDLLSENADERCVRLLPVALLILRQHGNANPTVETGWIDLIEWGMLASWRVYDKSANKRLQNAIWQVWVEFYLAELERYYNEHADELAIPFSLDKRLSGGLVDAIASALVAHWHAARLGLLALSYSCLRSDDKAAQPKSEAMGIVADWLGGLIMANPSVMRPVIDLHHIELFLVWRTFWQIGKMQAFRNYLTMLVSRLFVRRIGQGQIPFIEGRNSIELVFEHVATTERPYEFCDGSSMYLVCLMELCCSLLDEDRDRILEDVYALVLGRDAHGCEPIDLMLWMPPENWTENVLSKSLSDEGECVMVNLDARNGPGIGKKIASALVALVTEIRSKRRFEFPTKIPVPVIVLACLKHGSPIPPEFWNAVIFRPDQAQSVPQGDSPITSKASS